MFPKLNRNDNKNRDHMYVQLALVASTLLVVGMEGAKVSPMGNTVWYFYNTKDAISLHG